MTTTYEVGHTARNETDIRKSNTSTWEKEKQGDRQLTVEKRKSIDWNAEFEVWISRLKNPQSRSKSGLKRNETLVLSLISPEGKKKETPKLPGNETRSIYAQMRRQRMNCCTSLFGTTVSQTFNTSTLALASQLIRHWLSSNQTRSERQRQDWIQTYEKTGEKKSREEKKSGRKKGREKTREKARKVKNARVQEYKKIQTQGWRQEKKWSEVKWNEKNTFDSSGIGAEEDYYTRWDYRRCGDGCSNKDCEDFSFSCLLSLFSLRADLLASSPSKPRDITTTGD